MENSIENLFTDVRSTVNVSRKVSRICILMLV